MITTFKMLRFARYRHRFSYDIYHMTKSLMLLVSKSAKMLQ